MALQAGECRGNGAADISPEEQGCIYVYARQATALGLILQGTLDRPPHFKKNAVVNNEKHSHDDYCYYDQLLLVVLYLYLL